MNIRENLINISSWARPGIQLNSNSYIVLHYSGSDGGMADSIRNYYNREKYDSKGNLIYASSQYIVDLDGIIIKCIPENEPAWHAGNYNMNLNSIGIEMCVQDRLHTGSATAGDWHLTDETYNATLELVKDLMSRYNIPIDHVIRHYDVIGKYCPAMWVKNPQLFEEFKSKLLNIAPVEPIKPVFQNYQVQVTATPNLRKRSEPNTNCNVLGNYSTNSILTIVDRSNNWGKTSEGVWVCLDYTKPYVPVVAPTKWYARYRTNATINVRAGSGLNYKALKLYKQGQVFDICEEVAGWGHTPSGWVKLSFCTKI